MGNNHSASTNARPSGSKQDINSDDNVSQTIKMTRSPSGADIHDRAGTNFMPIEKLSKILMQKSQEKFNVNGISDQIFVSHVFPKYPDLGNRLYKYFYISSRATTKYLGGTAFRQQCERFLSILDDTVILETCIKMYCDSEKMDVISPDCFRQLLKTCFSLTISVTSGEQAKSCPMIDRTLDSVISACFFSKDYLSPGFVCRWLEQNCPRLVPPAYKYCVFTLTSAYRGIEINDQQIGLELATPVLEKSNPFVEGASSNKSQTPSPVNGKEFEPPLLPLSEAWLLAGALNPLYSRPQQVQSPITANSALASQVFISKLLSVVPSHWTLLYDSMEHGVGSNRFLHHVLGYKGPTLVLLRGNDDYIFCISSPGEWRETHMYTGGDHCSVIQLSPKFSLIEQGTKMLYLNTIIRGYPKGLRAGSDPRKPLISVDEHFEKFEYRGVPYILRSIEVWGCGDKQSRDIQLDIKKWQVKEAERQRTVKLTAADWIDHPDRYLLELGGRQNYNNSAN